MANKKVVRGYGQSRILINGTYYSFDVLSHDILPTEVWDKGFINNRGRKIYTVEGHWYYFKFQLTTLMTNSGFSINKDQTSMIDFLDAYNGLKGDQKEIYFIPFASDNASFVEADNVTRFLVYCTKTPVIKSFSVNKKLGQILEFEAETVQMIPVYKSTDGPTSGMANITVPYRNTSDGLWYNLPSNQNGNIKDSGSSETLQFKDGGSLEDVEYRDN